MKLINPFVILRILSTILFIESIAFLFCLPVAFNYEESPDPFLWSALITAAISVTFYIISRKSGSGKINKREGFLAVGLSWLVLTCAGTLPYLLGGTFSNFFDAFFESSSGYSTTGASVISDVESLGYSIIYYRSLTHWIGGLGIIVLVVIIIPSLGISANQLLPLESSIREKIHPKTKAVGFRLLFIYLALTLTEILLLNFGEMDLFESICHTFGTIATGGFSTRNDSLVRYSGYSQSLIMIFMFLAGVSYVIYYYMVKFNFRKIKYNDEFWFYIGTVLFFGTLTTGILLAKTTEPFSTAFRNGFFQVISIITTTGFISTDYAIWPYAGTAVIFILLFAGASTGSTTGSIKMVRHLVVLKNIREVMVRLIHPNAFSPIKLNNRVLPENTNISIISFVILYLFIFLIGTLIISIIGTDPVTAGSAVAACLGNIGPGLGLVSPMYNYSGLPELSKIIFSLLMIIGRLEIYSIFLLITKSFWKI